MREKQGQKHRVCGRERGSQVVEWGRQGQMCVQITLGAWTLNIALVTGFGRSWSREKGERRQVEKREGRRKVKKQK